MEKRNPESEIKTHRAQILWSLLVATALAVAALYQTGTAPQMFANHLSNEAPIARIRSSHHDAAFRESDGEQRAPAASSLLVQKRDNH